MTDGPPTLRDALESVAGDATASRLRPRVERLISRYRAGGSATSPILRDDLDALAYALYRSPATYAATRAALAQAAGGGLTGVRSVVDLGGGSGAAAWAARTVWPEATARVGDQVESLLDLGRRLSPGGIDFFRWRLGEPVPPAGLVTVAYVLSELTGAQQRELVEAARVAAQRAVLVIEPGTPDGYRRVLAARQQLLDAGWRLVAPCPHQLACPLAGGDWCHFAARVDRSVIHRRLKDGTLGYEDEKFSFCVAVVPTVPVAPAGEPRSRVIRHPLKRKGVVELTLCRPDGTSGRQPVSKRRGGDYRAARHVQWGDTWAPGAEPAGD